MISVRESRGVGGLDGLKRLRDTYARDDLTGGKRTVPVRLSYLDALIGDAEKGLQAEELAGALKELHEASDRKGNRLVYPADRETRWINAMQGASEALAAFDKQTVPQADRVEETEATL